MVWVNVVVALVVPRYRTSGGLDDAREVDGDMRFVGVNQRDDVSQLVAGELRESLNGRIDGYWQPRMGVELRSGALSSSLVPLRLPFWLVDTAGGKAVSAASLAGNVVSLTVTGHGFGYLANAKVELGAGNAKILFTAVVDGEVGNDTYVLINSPFPSPANRSMAVTQAYSKAGFFYPKDGIVIITVVPATDGSGNVSSTANDVIAAVNSAVSGFVTASLGTGSDGTSLVSNVAGYLENGIDGPAWLEVQGLGWTTTNPNGYQLVTATGVNTLTYPLTGANQTYTIGGADDKVLSRLSDGAASSIVGSCLFSDPANGLAESIILGATLDAKKVNLSDYTVTSLPYPSGEVLSGDVEMLQCFDRVLLFRAGGQAWEWVPAGKAVTASSVTSNMVTVAVPAHGLTTGDTVVLSGLTYSGTNPNGSRVVTVSGADTFTFALSSANEAHGVTSAKMVANGFTKMAGGVYTAPQSFSVREDAVVVADGYATLTVVGNTTVKSGDRIRVYGSEIAHFSDFVGREYLVSSASATSISFPIAAGDYTSAGTADFLYVGKNVPQGLGFIHMPGAPWGVYFQRRLWVPYFYEPGGTASAPTYADRNIRDEIMASDILDADTFDRVYSQFRITAGIADYLVGLQPFFNDALLVLMRNSLHLVAGTQGSLEDTVVTELTKEIGCLARRSVVGIGSAVFFLSDNGVYGVEFIDQYNLRGIQEPLSKSIQGYIDRINQDLADAAVGVYFNNRYYLAVPLDSAPKVGDAQGNNSVLVFNVLNRAWESVDTYGVGNFNIRRWHIGAAGERNSLYMVNEFGGIHECDATNTPVDRLSFNSLGEATTHATDYKMVTRGYTFGTYERKKFHEAQVTLKADIGAADAMIEFSTEDPDTDSYQVGQASALLGNEIATSDQATLRVRLGNTRGNHGSLTLRAVRDGSAPSGRPKVTSVAIEATVTNRATISQQ